MSAADLSSGIVTIFQNVCHLVNGVDVVSKRVPPLMFIVKCLLPCFWHESLALRVFLLEAPAESSVCLERKNNKRNELDTYYQISKQMV